MTQSGLVLGELNWPGTLVLQEVLVLRGNQGAQQRPGKELHTRKGGTNQPEEQTQRPAGREGDAGAAWRARGGFLAEAAAMLHQRGGTAWRRDEVTGCLYSLLQSSKSGENP